MQDIDTAKLLLRMAGKDFRALQGMLDSSIFASEIFGFHAQQAVEKALKSWLAIKGVEYPLTHDIGRLLRLLEREGEDVARFAETVKFNIFAVQNRYEEGSVFGDDELDRPAVIAEVGLVVDCLDRIINS